jgi:transcriptional regulator with XRE-family HTH domain
MTEKEFLKSLGKKIDELRQKKGLSFQELALRSNMEKATLVKLANHGTNITAATIFKIAKGLEVDPKTLFEG